MKKLLSSILLILLILTVCSFSIFKNKNESKLTIHFENFVGNELLKLDTMIYKNELNQFYSVSKFKYYIGNIHLKKMNGKEFISDKYFLVNEEEPLSKSLSLDEISNGDYTQISFIIGVDSLHNCSGTQTGALDPVNGMFWAWNTGYVFLKLEGHSPSSKSPGNIMEFHIGGYRSPFNSVRTITMDLDKYNVHLMENKNLSITIKADITKIFMSSSTIDFSKISSVTDFNNSSIIADNYSEMFSLKNVENK